jgi:hypothetical protein
MGGMTSQFKPSDRLIWVRSPGRSILEAWKLERVPGTVVRVCPRRVGIRVRLNGIDKLAIVDPANLIRDDGDGEGLSGLDNST